MSTKTNVQITTYNRKYKLDLSKFNEPEFGTDDGNTADDFAKAIINKIFVTTNDGPTETINTIVTSCKMTYGIGVRGTGESATEPSDINKCVFGVISDIELSSASSGGNSIMKLPEDAFYIFIFAHKDKIEEDTSIQQKEEPERNILRVHKIIKIPNTTLCHDVKRTGTDEDVDISHGLFCNGKCIVGIVSAVNDNDATFYLPSNSYCLEGRTQDIIKLSQNYGGSFKLSSFHTYTVPAN